ncbi:trehalase family glycosidase [Marinibacterium profundimaris]|uniref:Trehalase n=1 Tax=Marinibacterium profundimaris TaxID=1679460 RepID=A0A225NIY6_9RHOB|nr:trehalase family glycosidase [Marinibacterium profundimaris]OWU71050.1 trehalase [Marinibacterium profundimaris]
MEHLDQSLRDLFTDLHGSGLWPDEKAISDSILRAPAEEIRAAYAAAQSEGEVDLRAFHAAWFRPVQAPGEGYSTDPAHDAATHLDAVWAHLTRAPDDPAERSTRIPLPKPYVIAGGRFQEAYYWDSYFTQLGLLRVGRTDLVRDMLDNFAHAIASFGFIPNGFRSYFLTRSQPPFFAAMVADYGRATGDLPGALAAYLPAMEAEYRFFMETPRNHRGLGRYWDEGTGPRIEMYGTDIAWADHASAHPGFFRDLRAACESGWDFSSRWLADPMDLGTIRTTRIWPVDLNCLLLRMEEILAEATASPGPDRSRAYHAAAETRRAAIAARFFDDDRGYFFDLSIEDGTPIPVTSAAGLFPLWAGAATPDQAARAAAHVEDHLLAPGGLLTTDIASGQQWDSPNGWAPLQWIAIQGLRRYGHDRLADTLRRRWLETCETVFRQSGKFVEKYNVLDPTARSGGGEYDLQDGFGWSNGVYLDLLLEDT